jgi:multisubunit Na+/H+ antiporter MnhG subunit
MKTAFPKRRSFYTRLHSATFQKTFIFMSHYCGRIEFLLKAWVCGSLVAGIASTNPAQGMDVCLLCCSV